MSFRTIKKSYLNQKYLLLTHNGVTSVGVEKRRAV